MTLKEFIRSTDRDLKVGCVEGSNFIYVGNAKDLDGKSVDKANIKNLRVRLSGAKAKRKKGYYVKLRGITYKADDLIAKAEKELETYKPVESREVLETFESQIEDAVIVMIDGSDAGSYWLLSEARNHVK